MATKTITFPQVAEIALAVMSKANVSADDTTLAGVQAARSMLHGIKNGTFIVQPAAQPEAGAPPAAPPAAPAGKHGGQVFDGGDHTGSRQRGRRK